MLPLNFWIYIFMFVALIETQCTTASNVKNSAIAIDNSIRNCLRIETISQTVRNNVILLNTKIATLKNTGNCGCKSALLSYSVSIPDENLSNRVKEYHLFSSLRAKRYSFIITRNHQPESHQSYRLTIQCASPD